MDYVNMRYLKKFVILRLCMHMSQASFFFFYNAFYNNNEMVSVVRPPFIQCAYFDNDKLPYVSKFDVK